MRRRAFFWLAVAAALFSSTPSAFGQAAPSADDLATSILGAKLRASDSKVIVSQVRRGGVADRAGVRPGDQMQSIEKHKVVSLDDVAKVLKHFKPGDGVVMTVIPKTAPRQLYLAPPVQASAPSQPGGAMLGATLNDSSGSVVVGQLSMGGPAIIAGIRSGDQIVALDGKPLASQAQLLAFVNAASPGDRIDLTIQRGSIRRTLPVRLGARSQVARLAKMTVPSRREPQQPPASPAPMLDMEDQNDQWATEQEAEDMYNVNNRALYTDFD